MARKKRNEERENHDRWLVSYADFITLLFAFFVVMYSISSVNEGKYRVLSDSMVAAFRDPTRSLVPIQVGDLMRAPVQSETLLDSQKPIIDIFKVPLPGRYGAQRQLEQEKAGMEADQEEPHAGPIDEAAHKVADAIEAAMADLVAAGLIEVRRDKRWIEVEIKSRILFASGSAELSEASIPVLGELAETLKSLDNVIHVEGFTDNVPISNSAFLSNWELSAARAASVVHLFTRLGIAPQRLAAIGYGEFRPVASNDTAQGRAKNRRVVLVVMSGSDERINQRQEHLQTSREEPGGPTAPSSQARPAPLKDTASAS